MILLSESANRFVRLLVRLFRVELIYLYLSVILSAGTIAYILNANLIPSTSTFVRSLQAQSLIETIIYFVTIAMGSGGFYLIARGASSKQVKRESGFMFLGGIALILVTFVMIFSYWSLKIYG